MLLQGEFMNHGHVPGVSVGNDNDGLVGDSCEATSVWKLDISFQHHIMAARDSFVMFRRRVCGCYGRHGIKGDLEDAARILKGQHHRSAASSNCQE